MYDESGCRDQRMLQQCNKVLRCSSPSYSLVLCMYKRGGAAERSESASDDGRDESRHRRVDFIDAMHCHVKRRSRTDNDIAANSRR